jgi:hypothetical protein
VSGLPVTMLASVPTFVITGLDPLEVYPTTNVMEFAGGGPPIDGSLALAFFKVDPAFGTWLDDQRLAYWSGGAGGNQTINTETDSYQAAPPTGWKFI